jgi:hypothetical protein
MPLQPLLVHVHIPKCAGTSFNQILTQSFGDRHVPMYSPQPASCFSIDELENRLGQLPHAVAVSSHSIRLFPETIAGRRALYVLFVRDPLEWQISNITYLIENYHQLSDAHRATLPANCPEMSVKELIAWLRERNLRENRPRTDLTRFLALPSCEKAGEEPADELLVQTARRILDQCYFVGLVERLEDSVRLLAERLAEPGISLKIPAAMPELNRSAHRRGDLSWINESDPLGSRILSRLARDRAVYDHAAGIFHHLASMAVSTKTSGLPSLVCPSSFTNPPGTSSQA